MANYMQLSRELQSRIKYDIDEGNEPNMAFKNDKVIRRNNENDRNTIWRPSFARDVDKIMHSAYYNRYTDKTQVFSFYKNDDITRRALHVQLVSRIARNIGQVLGLNLDLIEAIALGHDIGHTPFGHAGEDFLNKLYKGETGRYFKHNVHSVRVLDGIFPYNISLQTLDGIVCHNGEFELKEYRPSELNSFSEFDERLELANIEDEDISSKKMIPSTLEGCVVRICDMIAYVGKDRQDAFKAKLISSDNVFDKGSLGNRNGEIINNLVVNIIENSYGKNYIKLDEEYYNHLKLSKKQNYEYIYKNPEVKEKYNNSIQPMFEEIYQKLLGDLKNDLKNSVIFKHHISLVENIRRGLKCEIPYREEEPNQIVVDYIASMTDDYFIDLYKYLSPESTYKVNYVSYFSDL